RPRLVSVAIPPTGSLEVDVRMVALPTMLEPVQVFDQPNCPRRDDAGIAFALWEQAQTALLASVVSRESNPASMLRVVFARRRQGNNERVSRQTVRFDSAARATKSFHAV